MTKLQKTGRDTKPDKRDGRRTSKGGLQGTQPLRMDKRNAELPAEQKKTVFPGQGNSKGEAIKRGEAGGTGRKGATGKRVEAGGTGRKGETGKRGEAGGTGRKGATGKPGKTLCPAAGRCGGCQWIDRDYQEQLKSKETRFRRLMEPYCKTEPMIGMEQPAHYRNKVHAVFGEDRKHNIISGIYEEKSHRIVPLDQCYLENPKADQIIVSIRGLLKSFKIRPYNEDTGLGLLRHVLIRVGHATDQIMVVLVLSSPVMPSKNNFVKALRKLHPEITTIVLNINNRDTTMVLGDKEQVLYGKGYIEDEICGKIFRISAKSFYQVNPVQAEILYRKALEYAGLTGRETVVDAYCGTGTIGIIAADGAGRVIGVEANPDAVRDARINAKQNQIEKIEFYQNDAGKLLREMAEQGVSVDLVMLDPPRSGSSEEFLEAAVRLAPARIVYISCNPDTLVRDLKYLTAKGYEAKRAVAVDLFPFTEHVETVCLLSNRKPDTKVRIDVDLEDYYRIKDAKKNQN